MNYQHYQKVLEYIQGTELFYNRITDISRETDLSCPTIRKILVLLLKQKKIIEVKHGSAKHYQAMGDDDK